jgi:hypothetical protein
VTWQADDPDGDRLLYSLYFRGEDEKEWKLLRANIAENSLLLDGDVLADGRYYFRVIASDQPSNAANVARTDELVSSPVLIDNTPPVITLSAPRRSNDRVEVDADVVDQTSPLRRFEYSLDAGPWTPVEAADGVTDSPREQYHIAIDRLRAGRAPVSGPRLRHRQQRRPGESCNSLTPSPSRPPGERQSPTPRDLQGSALLRC